MGSSAPSIAPSSRHAPEGRYEIAHEIARGGMGVVYRAYDRLAKREVAYKRLLSKDPAQHGRFAALLEREYNALASLSHPNVVEVYEYGFDTYGPYYTMELLLGDDLSASAPLPIARACALLRDVASALSLVHARRLVHRDITPNNVRLTREARAKVIDFGALVPFGPSEEIIGTGPFVAPECFTGGALDARTDLFSLGALAYWMLTHTHAFAANNLDERVRDLTLEPAPPSTLRADIPKSLDELVLSLLHVDPLARPASAAEVMERLTAIGGLPSEPDARRVAFSYVERPPLIGRDHALARARAVVSQRGAEGAQTLVVKAAPGLGKTAYLDHVTIEAQLAGKTVLRARGGVHVRPFDVAHSLVRGGLGAFPDLARASANAPSFPQDVRGASHTVADAAAQHADTVEWFCASLLAVAARNPVVIILDDAERADAESLAVLAALAQQADPASLRLVLSLSSRAVVTQGAALERLIRDGEALELSPLEPSDMHELVQSVCGPVPNAHRLARWLWEQSAGTPASCVNLLRLLLKHDVIRYENGTFILPHDILLDVGHLGREAEIARLTDLSDVARSVLTALSLQDKGMPRMLLAPALGLDDNAVQLALEELTRRGLLVQGVQLAVGSDALRAAVRESLTDSERRRLHLRIAHSLSKRAARSFDADVAIGENLMRGGEEVRGALLLARAAQLERYEPGSAPMSVALLEDVLAVLEREGCSEAQCAPVLMRLSWAGYFSDYQVQIKYFERTLHVLSELTGVTLARRLTPYCGPRLAIYLGLFVALLRHMFRPPEHRFGSFRDMLQAFLTIAMAGTAAAASALDNQKAFDVLSRIEPLRALRANSAPYLAYEFCLASAEIGSGQSRAGGARHQSLIARLDRGPVLGLSPQAHAMLRLACLYGQAQAVLFDDSPLALRLADELERGHPFYRSHAETTRMAYYARRGEHTAAEHYRERAEMAALRGGVSWSALTVLSVRSLYADIGCRNASGLSHLVPELARLARFAPNMELYHEMATAYLALLRGHPEEAVAKYEQVLADPRHAHLPTCHLDRVCYARALCESGRFEEAKRVCLSVLEHKARQDIAPHEAMQQLALAEAGLGDLKAAAARLDACLKEFADRDNPLVRGSLHRDRARVALMAADERTFNEHFDAMVHYFRSTQNPWLIRQYEQLAAEARRAGLSVRSDAARRESGALALSSLHISLPATPANSVEEDPSTSSAVTVVSRPHKVERKSFPP